MRRPEEKTLMIIEAVGLLFISLSTVVFEIANNTVEEKRAEISENLQGVNFYGIKKIDSNLHNLTLTFFYYMISDLQIIPKKIPSQVGRSLDAEKRIYSDQAKIKYLLQGINYFNDNVKQEENNVKQEKYYVKLATDKNIIYWQKVRAWANIVRIIAILVSAYFYILIFKAIGYRIGKEKSM